ncbi:MAG: peptidoglycan editing factor PgeF [Alphaproteobacteria bacterium]|nr:peptidoglycan editing factor PgeF [Alphaproteobacteria bacterium]
MILAPDLPLSNGVAHGFFGRLGGVSQGVYASLNVGYGLGDDPDAVRENRRRCMAALDRREEDLVTLYQVHSPAVIEVKEPWLRADAPRADGMVTKERGIVLGILTADCAPVLFADAQAGVIGAAHAGWKGALAGVLEETIAAMERLGARRAHIKAVIGPTISQAAYEVGMEFKETFLSSDALSAGCFVPGERAGKAQFDLPLYAQLRLRRAGLEAPQSIGLCTYAGEADYFSFRRTTHRGEPDYGRNLSAITLRI